MCLAVPGKVLDIVELDAFQRRGRVDFGQVVREVDLSLVPETVVGDYVIVHVGMAISVLDQDQARQVLETLAELAQKLGKDRS